VESRSETSTPYYAGAFTGFTFLTSVYLDNLGIVDLSGGGFLTTFLVLLIFLPFVVFVVRKSVVEFWTVVWRDEAERTSAVAKSTARFWRFAGGMLLVFVPGSFVLFALIS
jgi:hypothetical protein